MTTLHDIGGVLGRSLALSFGHSQSHGHGSWLVCEVAQTSNSNRGDSLESSLAHKVNKILVAIMKNNECTIFIHCRRKLEAKVHLARIVLCLVEWLHLTGS